VTGGWSVDFDIEDCNGYRLCFGQVIDA